MSSKEPEAFFSQLNTSALTTDRLVKPSFSFTELIKAVQRGCLSTAVTETDPREQHSKDILPVPAKRSSTWQLSRSKLFSRMLKRDSLARSVVGLTGKPAGTRSW